MENLPCKRVVNSLDELEVTDCIATQSGREVSGEAFESLQMLSELKIRNVVDNVEQCYASASIFDGLLTVSSGFPEGLRVVQRNT